MSFKEETENEGEEKDFSEINEASIFLQDVPDVIRFNTASFEDSSSSNVSSIFPQNLRNSMNDSGEGIHNLYTDILITDCEVVVDTQMDQTDLTESAMVTNRLNDESGRDSGQHNKKVLWWKSKKALLIIILLAIIAIASIFGLSITKRRNQGTQSLHSQQFALYVKNLLVPISGEILLDDPMSLQHYLWRKISHIPPEDLPNNMHDPTFELQITQMFIILVTRLTHIDFNYLERDINLKASDYGFECSMFPCNDQGQILVFFQLGTKSERSKGLTVPIEIGGLTGLEYLILSKHNLSGKIPSEFGKLRNLHALDVHGNSLSGTIPKELGQLQSLKWILLNNNELSSSIPEEIGNLSNLVFGDFSQNKLTGSLPSSFVDLPYLQGLDISQNSIVGNLDLLCEKNFTNEPFQLYTDFGNNVVFSYDGISGLIGDCDDDVEFSQCSCCTCQ